jgi:uncharacterized membrane protein
VTFANQTKCPHCGQVYTVEPWQAGQRFACVRCSQEFVAGIPQAPAGPAALGYPMPGLIEQPRTSGMAIASLVLGLLFCVPLAGVLAIIFGAIALSKTKTPGIGGKGMAIAGMILGCFSLVFLPAMMIPSFSRARETANRVKCAQNLRQIEQAIVIYTNTYNGAYPPDLGTLYKDQQLDLHLFVCPDTSTTPPPNMSVDQAEQWVNMNSDYVYVGSGMASPAPANALIIYEKDQDHAPDGNNILYGSGVVAFVPTATVHQLLAQNNISGSGH